MVSVSTSVFKSPVTDCAFWSPAMMLLTAIFINIPSLLISTRIWCFRQIVYDIAGTGLEAAAVRQNVSNKYLIADLKSTCLHPGRGYDYIEEGLKAMVKLAEDFDFDPIHRGKHPERNHRLWSGARFRQSRRHFWISWYHHCIVQIVSLVLSYIFFMVFFFRLLRKRHSIIFEKRTLMIMALIDSLLMLSGIVHYAVAFFSLAGMSRMELNFFFALVEFFAIGWSMAVLGFLFSRFGMILALQRVHADAIRFGEIREKDIGQTNFAKRFKQQKQQMQQQQQLQQQQQKGNNESKNADWMEYLDYELQSVSPNRRVWRI